MLKITTLAAVLTMFAAPALAFESSTLPVDGTALDVAEARGAVALVVQWTTAAPSPKLARIMGKPGGLVGLDSFAAEMARGGRPDPARKGVRNRGRRRTQRMWGA